MTADEIGWIIFGHRWDEMDKTDALKAIEGTIILLNCKPSKNRIQSVKEAVYEAVYEHFGYTAEDLKSRQRSARLTDARMIAIYVFKQLTNMGDSDMARVFNFRNRSTIIYYHKRMDELSLEYFISHSVDVIMDKVKSKLEE